MELVDWLVGSFVSSLERIFVFVKNPLLHNWNKNLANKR